MTTNSTAKSAERRISLTASNRPRRPVHPARRKLLLAMVLVMVGSFLPWVYAAGIAKSGILGPGLWTFYASMLGLAGVLLPYYKVGGVHAGLMAAVALLLPLWQVQHAIDVAGFSGWKPGPGLVLVFGGGVVAAVAAVRMLREPAPSA